MRKRIFKVVALILLVPILLLLFLVFERVRGQISLGRYERQLIAKGEKLSLGDLARPPATGENGAPEIITAVHELKEGTVLTKSYLPRMRLTPSGHAIVCFRENQWVDDKKTNDWEHLAADLEANEAILKSIRAALKKPVMNNGLDYSQGFKMQFLHLAPAKKLTQWFGPAAQFALHDGSNHDALENLLAELELPRVLGEDRILISELVRIAIAAIARTDTWEALQADGWTDRDLARLQQAWESLHFAAPMVHALEGEMIFGQTSYEMMRKSNEDTFAAIFGLDQFMSADDRPKWEQIVPGGAATVEFFKKQVCCRVWRFAWLAQEQRHYLEDMQKLLTLNRAAVTNCSAAAVRPGVTAFEEEAATKSLYDRLRYLDAQSVVTMSRVVHRAMRAETERSLVLCGIALKRYSLKHGKAPPSLDSLVPEFISSIPVDYMDAKPMRYRLETDGTFKLYSVAEDGKDDGGDVSMAAGKTNVRDLWARKDFVWPRPATPGEIEAYRARPE